MRVAILVVTLMLSGCGLSPLLESHQDQQPNALLKAVGDRFAHGPLSDVVARYGVPTSQTVISGYRVFVWDTTATLTFQHTTKVTTQGEIGSPAQYPYLASVPYQQTTTVPSTESGNFACSLQVYVDANNIVVTLGLYGQMGACRRFSP